MELTIADAIFAIIFVAACAMGATDGGRFDLKNERWQTFAMALTAVGIEGVV